MFVVPYVECVWASGSRFVLAGFGFVKQCLFEGLVRVCQTNVALGIGKKFVCCREAL